ncbi:hypothetical protein EDD86DRAFT_248487 [Gorgonomyces haynaldii]|nr:hypothetical protein EDD86DRAFT_248487 [Gorgonomyces haynaldii]
MNALSKAIKIGLLNTSVSLDSLPSNVTIENYQSTGIYNSIISGLEWPHYQTFLVSKAVDSTFVCSISTQIGPSYPNTLYLGPSLEERASSLTSILQQYGWTKFGVIVANTPVSIQQFSVFEKLAPIPSYHHLRDNTDLSTHIRYMKSIGIFVILVFDMDSPIQGLQESIQMAKMDTDQYVWLSHTNTTQYQHQWQVLQGTCAASDLSCACLSVMLNAYTRLSVQYGSSMLDHSLFETLVVPKHIQVLKHKSQTMAIYNQTLQILVEAPSEVGNLLSNYVRYTDWSAMLLLILNGISVCVIFYCMGYYWIHKHNSRLRPASVRLTTIMLLGLLFSCSYPVLSFGAASELKCNTVLFMYGIASMLMHVPALVRQIRLYRISAISVTKSVLYVSEYAMVIQTLCLCVPYIVFLGVIQSQAPMRLYIYYESASFDCDIPKFPWGYIFLFLFMLLYLMLTFFFFQTWHLKESLNDTKLLAMCTYGQLVVYCALAAMIFLDNPDIVTISVIVRCFLLLCWIWLGLTPILMRIYYARDEKHNRIKSELHLMRKISNRFRSHVSQMSLARRDQPDVTPPKEISCCYRTSTFSPWIPCSLYIVDEYNLFLLRRTAHDEEIQHIESLFLKDMNNLSARLVGKTVIKIYSASTKLLELLVEERDDIGTILWYVSAVN